MFFDYVPCTLKKYTLDSITLFQTWEREHRCLPEGTHLADSLIHSDSHSSFRYSDPSVIQEQVGARASCSLAVDNRESNPEPLECEGKTL